MSLILEALRKSEQQRRLGEPPTLDSESAWAARRWHGTPTRAARWPWIAGAFVLLAVGGAAWWWLRPVVDTDAPPAAAPAAEAAPDTRPVAATRADSASPAADAAPPATAPAAAPPAAAPTPPPVAPPTMAAEPVVVGGPIDPSIQARLNAPTPAPDGEYPEGPAPADAAAVMTPAPAAGTRAAAPPAATAPVATEALPAVAPVSATPAAPDAAAPPEAVAPAAARPAAPPTAASTAPVATAPVDTPAPPPVAPPASGDVPLVYALPLATRQALPPLKLAMHVWNADPARRFVILGDSRAAEGESAGSELTVVEIRRDGVVLDFRGTRFLLPRGGY
jgi:general secretion pathway protein B